jgi:hypothetical protein
VRCVGNDSEPPPIRAFNDGCTRWMDTNAVCRFKLSIINRAAPSPFANLYPPFDCFTILPVFLPCFLFLHYYHYSTTTTPPRVLHGARCHPHPWYLSPLPKTFYATRLLSRCFRRLRSRSFAQDMVEKRGCTVCGGRASSSGAYEEVGADRGPSRVVSLTHFVTSTSQKRNTVFLLSRGSHIQSVHGLGLTLTSFFQKVSPHGQLYTLCAFVMSFVFLIRAVMLILDHSILSRGLFHTRLPMPTSSRACRNAGR